MSINAGSASSDIEARNHRPFNKATSTTPCVVHANGWEKMPLIDIVTATGEMSKIERQEILKQKSLFDKTKVQLTNDY